jgi:hypothetical protein
MEGLEPCLCLPDVHTSTKISLNWSKKGIRKQVGYITCTQNSPETHKNAQGPLGETRASNDKQPPGGMPKKNRKHVPRTAPRRKKILYLFMS